MLIPARCACYRGAESSAAAGALPSARRKARNAASSYVRLSPHHFPGDERDEKARRARTLHPNSFYAFPAFAPLPPLNFLQNKKRAVHPLFTRTLFTHFQLSFRFPCAISYGRKRRQAWRGRVRTRSCLAMAYSFTLPRTMPLAKYFCRKGYTHRIGSMVRKIFAPLAASAEVMASTSSMLVSSMELSTMTMERR